MNSDYLNFKIVDETGRIDKILQQKLGISRSQVQKLLVDEKILINDIVQKANYKVKQGDLVRVLTIARPELSALPEDIPIDIVYEDEDVLVVNKPQGMVVHPANGHPNGTLVNAILYHTKLPNSGVEFRPGIVHRIDKDTSGLLMIAKSELALKELSQQLKEKTSWRKYFALVSGQINEDEGTIDAPLSRDPNNRLKRAVVDGGKKAVTHFKVIKRYNDYTFISCQLETGRTHQIRVHLNYIGHPIVGDPMYGKKKTLELHFGQLLHAGELGFYHPRTKEFMKFKAPLPAYFENILENLI